jgi:opacity protein-like surface antigen
MKTAKVFLVTVALLALVAGTARAEVYVEAYIGGNFPAQSSNPLSAQPFLLPTTLKTPGIIDPAFMGGLKVGTWFVREGFLGFNYPAWMKYLGFYLDFSYHRVDYHLGFAKVIVNGMSIPGPYTFKSEGNAVTLAFMFAFRYGFFPDKEVPFGRLQPYVAVGPAILFSSQQFTFGLTYPATPNQVKSPSDSSVDLALAVETGIRWMALKNVSLDVSFKYRYARPTYTFPFSSVAFAPNTWRLRPDFNFFSVQVGAAYHF